MIYIQNDMHTCPHTGTIVSIHMDGKWYACSFLFHPITADRKKHQIRSLICPHGWKITLTFFIYTFLLLMYNET